jgi:hypothetical protein
MMKAASTDQLVITAVQRSRRCGQRRFPAGFLAEDGGFFPISGYQVRYGRPVASAT